MRFRFMFMCVLLVLALTVTYAAAAPIHDAAGKGNLAKVKALLKKAPKLVNLADKDGATPLHYATSGNHKSVVELLLSKNANVNAKKKNGVTPLHIAAAMGRTEIVKLLLAKGAKIGAVDNKDRTPVSLAEESGQTEMIELLAAEGMRPTTAIAPGTKIGDVCVNPKDGAEMVWVPAGGFLMGSTEQDLASISTYDPEWTWKPGEPQNEMPQHEVRLGGYWIYKYEVTVAQFRKFCYATGWMMHQAPRWGWNDDHPMCKMSRPAAEAYAAWAGVRLPNESEWEKAARGTDGRWFPWGNAWDASKCANHANSKTTKPVTQFPGDVSPYGVIGMAGNVYEWCSDRAITPYPYKPLAPTENVMGVCRGGSFVKPLRGVRCAVRRRQQPDSYDEDVGFRCVLPADQVLKPDTHSNDAGRAPTQDEINTIMEAARKGNLAQVTAMINANPQLMHAHVTGPLSTGWTALHFAAAGGHKEVAMFLIDRGADVSIRRESGWTPLHNAASSGNKEIVELLIGKGADVNCRTDAGWTPLHAAAYFGKLQVAELLISKNADVNAKQSDKWGDMPAGATPLKNALLSTLSSPEMAALLRKHGGTE